MMTPEVKEIYDRGFDASYNEYNPFSRTMPQYYWWNAGFVDAWGQAPKLVGPVK